MIRNQQSPFLVWRGCLLGKVDHENASPLPYDGSVLHALERLFPLSLSAEHLRIATTNVVGLTR
ncbi:MAG: rhamnan synthesis F family protein [Desulfoarculaceae bacterium]|nr:rhamnan synthesis F family protein [Desulfoarculaceae bacterium]